jgi:opacity protein-like surface antigen
MVKKSGGMTTLLTASIAAALAPQASLAAGKHHATYQSSLERRLEVMEQEMQALRAELEASRAKTEAETAEAKSEANRAAQQVQAQQAKVDQNAAELAKHDAKKDDMVFFRGGWAAMNHARTSELLVNNNPLSPNNFGSDKSGWYVGAGLDHRLSDDTFGISDDLALDAEIMFDYKNYGSVNNSFVSGVTGTRVEAQVTMFSLYASPKLKYTGIEGFRPWIVPFGLSINVVSPPSSGVTVLNPGLMLGTGLEYNIFKNLWVGADFRYNFTGGDLNYSVRTNNGKTILNSTDTDNYTAGAYVGIGF